MNRLPRRAALLALAVLLAATCRSGGDEPSEALVELVPGGMTTTVRAVFDSATAAYAAGELPRAHELFSEAIAGDSMLAAAWLGLSLVERAMGRVQGRDTALDRARSLIEPPVRPRGRATNPAT